MNSLNKIFISIIFFPISLAHAQQLTGSTGLLFTPDASIKSDKTLSFGSSFFSTNTLGYFNGNNQAILAYVDLTFLPFVSIGINLMRPLNYPENIYGVGDRSVTFKFRILNENKSFVSLALGIQDALHILNSDAKTNTDFNSSFLVLSKTFSINDAGNSIGLSVGYAKKRSTASFYDMNGLFGGIKITLFSLLNIILEYDSRFVNTAIGLNLYERLNLLVGARKMKNLVCSASYAFNL